MIFLRALHATRWTESQQTRRPRVSTRRWRSTRFPQLKEAVSGIRDNCHCLSWRLLAGWFLSAIAARIRDARPRQACLFSRPCAFRRTDETRANTPASLMLAIQSRVSVWTRSDASIRMARI